MTENKVKFCCFFLFPVLEAIKENPALQKAHLGLPQEEIEEQMKRQLEEYVVFFCPMTFCRTLILKMHKMMWHKF